jgi:ribosomal protein S18 acetylase RimI-like enzyme
VAAAEPHAEVAPELRATLAPGDLGAVVALHGEVYAREHGLDARMEAHVAAGLGELARNVAAQGERAGRLWVAARGARVLGSVGITRRPDEEAQLRWFIVRPEARGSGLGHRLLDHALGYARAQGYRAVVLETFAALRAAGHLYREAGFTRVAVFPGTRWGPEVSEERWRLELVADGRGAPFAAQAVPVEDPGARALFAGFDAEMRTRYGRLRSPTRDDVFRPPGGCVVVLYAGDRGPAAVGAIQRHDLSTAEVRRIYVAPEHRGRGAGRALLGALEEAARAAGYERARLDTGSRQPEALALFRSAGYEAIPDYNGNALASFWFEKAL